MGKSTGTNVYDGTCMFCDQSLASRTGAQYHVQVQHGEEIAERMQEDAATRRAGGTIHPYRRARREMART